MATGGKLSRTLEGGQEAFLYFPCPLCEKEGKYVEAVRYCEECFVSMCDSCVRNHDRFPLNSRHKLLDQRQFATNRPTMKSFPTKRCLKHPGELIKIFCAHHDVVCCSVCKALEHSDCTRTKHLPDAAKGIEVSLEYQNIKKETKKFLSEVDKVLQNRKTDTSNITKEKQQVKQTIANFRKKIDNYLDDLEQKSLAELDFREMSIANSINQDTKYLDTAKAKAEDILKQMESFKGENECELFVQVKTSKQFVHDGMEKVQKISVQKDYLQFIINPQIEIYLSTLEMLGTFFTSPATSDTRVAKPKESNVSSTKRADHSEDIGHYRTQLFERYNVEEKSDSNVCQISDICQLPNGNILVTVNYNKKLKRLDMSYKLDFVQLSKHPDSVCAVGSDKAAVSLFIEKKMQIVSVRGRLTLTNHLEQVTTAEELPILMRNYMCVVAMILIRLQVA